MPPTDRIRTALRPVKRFITVDNFFKLLGALTAGAALLLLILQFRDEPAAEPVLRWVEGFPDMSGWSAYVANDGDESVTIYRIRWGVYPKDSSGSDGFVECEKEPSWGDVEGPPVLHIPPGQVSPVAFAFPDAGCTLPGGRGSIRLSSDTMLAIYVKFYFSHEESTWQRLWPAPPGGAPASPPPYPDGA